MFAVLVWASGLCAEVAIARVTEARDNVKSPVEAAVDIAATLDARISALSCAILPHGPKSIRSGTILNVGAIVGQERHKVICGAQQLLRSFSEAARLRNVLGQELYRECLPSEVPALLAGYARLQDMTIVPLPEGAITEQAKATFRDGVLEITMPAPPEQVSRGRRLEITEGGSQ